MKRAYLFTLIFSIIIVSSCGNAANNNSANSNSTASTKADQNKIKPEHLTLETFKEKVWDFETNPDEWIYKGDVPAIIDFYADWCGPCKIIAPIMEELANKYKGRVKIYKIDTDKEQDLARAFGIRGIPSVLFTPLEGRPMMQSGAMQKQDYIKIIEEQLLKNTTKKD